MRRQAALFLIASLPGACVAAQGLYIAPATPAGFRCGSISETAIEFSWERSPDSSVGKPVFYSLSSNGKDLAGNLTVLRFTVQPSMMPGGRIEPDRPYSFRLQAIDPYVRTAGDLPTTSAWTGLTVWIQANSLIPTSCKPE